MRLQFMSISALVLVALMVTELFIFVLVVIGYNNLFQYASLSQSSTNYGTLLSQSANSFAKSALSSSLNALFSYEYNASARRGYFITNMSNSVSSLIETGSLPGVAPKSSTANMLLSYMNNATFAAYNSEISNFTGFSSKNVVITETVPTVTQYNPYSLSIDYIETVMINASGDIFDYSIPINASVPLNDTPDLLYAEQQIIQPIKFANISASTSVIGGQQAIAGNTFGFAYGTVYYAPYTAVSCTPFTNNIPAPLIPNTIIVTPSANNLAASCLNQFGGLITQAVNAIPSDIPKSIPMLIYNSTYFTTNAMKSLQTGAKVLLYGPSLSTLNIEPLRTDIYNNYYFTSPFAPSYIERLQGNFSSSSAGIFTVYDYNRQVAGFSSPTANAYIQIPSGVFNYPQSGSPTKAYTLSVSAWFQAPSSGGGVILGYDNAAPGSSTSINLPALYVDTNGNLRASMFWHGSVGDQLVSSGTYNDKKWHNVVDTYSNGVETLYIDGQLIATNTVSEVPQSTTFFTIGTANTIGWPDTNGGWFYFDGQIANFQVYNSLLTQQQVGELYDKGVGGVPISGNSLQAWYTLSGNTLYGNGNDLSGNNYNGIVISNVIYVPLTNYRADPVYGLSYTGRTYTVPGILNCDSNSECRDTDLQHVYLGTAPLETGSNYAQALSINTSYPGWVNISMTGPGAFGYTAANTAISAWIYLTQVPHNNAGIVTMNSPISEPPSGSGYGGLSYFMNGDCNVQVIVSSSGAGSPYSTDSNTCLKTGRWYNVIAYLNQSGDEYGLYINGTLDPAFPQPFTGAPYQYTGFFIGNFFYQNANFPGYITNVQIYNDSVSPKQANIIYHEGIGGRPLQGLGLLGWWPLNGNVKDYSGYNQNGTLDGMTGFATLYGGNSTTPGSTIYQTQDEWQSIGLSDPK